MVIKQNVPHVVLEEQGGFRCIAPLDDIASNASVSLKRWLATRAFTATGKKADLVEGYVFFLVQAIEALSSIACVRNLSLRAMECGTESIFLAT